MESPNKTQKQDPYFKSWHKDLAPHFREQPGLLDAILDQTASGIVVCDPQGKIIYLNPVAQALISPHLDNLSTHTIASIQGRVFYTNGDEMPLEKWSLTRALRGETIHNREERIIRPDGSYSDILVTAAPLRDPQQAILGCVATCIDITERKQNELYTTAIIENADEPIVSRSLDGTIVTWNQGAERVYGYNANEMIGKPISLLFPEGYEDEHSRLLDLLHQEQQVISLETKRRRKDGSDIDMSLTASPIRDAQGQIIGISAIAHDITGRKQIEQALRDSEQGFRQLADAMPQLVWTARPDGTVDYYNQRYTEFSGITPGEGENWQWSPVLHPDDMQSTMDAWTHAVQTGDIYEVEHRVYRADGTARWYLSRGVPARNEKGDIIKWYGTATDIHEQKLAEERVSTILNSISDGFLTIDEDWNITYFNAAAEQILGISAADVMGRNFWDVFPFARNSLFEERYTWAMREHKPTSFEARYEAEPYENWYEVRVSPHGQGLSLYFQVITERKLAEEQIRYQALVLENISDIVFTTDLNFRAVSWNHAAEQHYGWTADDMIGQDPAKLLHTNYLSTSQEKARQQFITTGKWVGEIERTRKDGHVVAVSASANMLYDEHGNPIGMVCVERDITEQKRIVETVQAQADLLEQTHDAIFTWGSDNNIIHWYEGATRLYGWTREEAIGQPAHELLKSYPMNDWHEVYAELRRTGRWRGEITHTSKNGERIIVESQMVLVRHSDNRELVLEINRDITERKWVEQIVAQTHTKVLEQQRKLETILSTLPVGVFITDRNGQITQINKKADEIFRQPPFAGGEFKQCKGWWPDTGQMLAPEDWPAARALASGKATTNEVIDIERFDGTRGTILASAAPLQTVDGDINGAVLVVSDITERRQIEQALRESEQRMRTVLENMPVALIAMDEQQQFIAWNKECERITGYPANEIIGNPQAFELLIPDQTYREQVLTELDEPSYRNWEIVFSHRDGAPRYVDWSNIADEFPVSGWASWSVGVDITERKWAEQQTLELMAERERVRVLTDFVRSISHDFKTPLSTINTSTYLLRRLTEGDQQQRHVEQIQRQTSRINELLDGMLTMTRLDDDPNLILQPMNFNRMIETVLIQAGPQSSSKGIALVTETTDEILLVQADEIELHRALSELVENAIQFTPDQGMITLRTYRAGSAMGFEVQDTGLGIPHEELIHIFKRLYRIDKARSTDTGGIGLGLSIAARIIELHHGSIEVESVVGEGSTFRVRLPLVRT